DQQHLIAADKAYQLAIADPIAIDHAEVLAGGMQLHLQRRMGGVVGSQSQAGVVIGVAGLLLNHSGATQGMQQSCQAFLLYREAGMAEHAPVPVQQGQLDTGLALAQGDPLQPGQLLLLFRRQQLATGQLVDTFAAAHLQRYRRQRQYHQDRNDQNPVSHLRPPRQYGGASDPAATTAAPPGSATPEPVQCGSPSARCPDARYPRSAGSARPAAACGSPASDR